MLSAAESVLALSAKFEELRVLVRENVHDTARRNSALTAIGAAERRVGRALYAEPPKAKR